MVQIIAIDDADDPRVAPYLHVRERDLVGRQRRFVAEGEVVLRVLARSTRFAAESVLVAEKRLAKLKPVLDKLPPQTPLFSAGEAVLDAIAGFHLHRGVLAIGRRPVDDGAEALVAALPARALALVLFGIANHDNMGGLFRNAAAFGVDAVILDPTSCDPLYRKAIRVSVGGALSVPFARLGQGEDALDLMGRQGFEVLALSPAGDTPLSAVVRPPRCALALGAEGPGLPSAILQRARAVAIPMAGGFDSLNVATTSGIVLHHLTR